MKTIIVLTDFSKAATNAARYAAALAHQFSATKLVLFNSYEFKPVATDIPMTSQASIAAQREESFLKLEKLKNELQSLIPDEIAIQTIAVENSLIYAVHGLSEQYDNALTVMGITGLSGIERAIIGSNTITVAREITTPLLLVPHAASFEDIKKVVFATDLKDDIGKAASYIKTIVGTLGAGLLILNVEKTKMAHEHPAFVTAEGKMRELWDKEHAKYHFVESEDIGKGILDFIKTHDVQLAIAIPKHHSFFEGLLHKSVTKRLTYHSPIPLLLLQPD